MKEGAARWKWAVLLAALSLMGGCSSFPNQVAAPSINYPATQAGAKADYKVSGDSIGYHSGSQAASTILPVETTLPGVQTQILAMQAAYLSRQEKLLREVDSASNLQFFGMIASAAGVATKSNAWRNGGAGVAGLSNLWSSHYSIAVQATNYGLAAQALDCVSGEIDYITPSFWSGAYDNQGVFQIPKKSFEIPGASAADVATSYDALANMYPTIHKAITGIDHKLRALQASIQIPTVSVSDIQNAVTAKTTEKNAGDAAANNLKPAVQAKQDQQQAALDAAKKTAAESQAAADKAAKDLQIASSAAKEQRDIVSAKTLNTLQTRATLMSLQAPDLPSELQAADESTKKAFVERRQLNLADAKAKADQALLSSATESAKQTSLDALETAAQTAAQLAAAQAAKDAQAAKEAADKLEVSKKFLDLLDLGVVSKAIQLPSSLNACVAVMGK